MALSVELTIWGPKARQKLLKGALARPRACDRNPPWLGNRGRPEQLRRDGACPCNFCRTLSPDFSGLAFGLARASPDFSGLASGHSLTSRDFSGLAPGLLRTFPDLPPDFSGLLRTCPRTFPDFSGLARVAPAAGPSVHSPAGWQDGAPSARNVSKHGVSCDRVHALRFHAKRHARAHQRRVGPTKTLHDTRDAQHVTKHCVS
jgi:hypothetical protein